MRTITIRKKHLPVRVIQLSKVTEKIAQGQDPQDYYLLPHQEFLVFAHLVKGVYTSRQLCRQLPITHANSVIRNLRERGFPVLYEWVWNADEHRHKLFWIKVNEEEEL